jgi:hypothetical protein
LVTLLAFAVYENPVLETVFALLAFSQSSFEYVREDNRGILGFAFTK